MKPDCFGTYTPAARTACASCVWRGPCAAKTEVGPFTFLAFPIYPKAVSAPAPRRVAVIDAELRDAVMAQAMARGFKRNGRALRAFRRTVALVDPGVQNTVRVTFPAVTTERLREMAHASRALIRRLTVGGKHLPKDNCTRRHLREYARLGEVGSVALLSSAADAVDLIVEVATRLCGGHRD